MKKLIASLLLLLSVPASATYVNPPVPAKKGGTGLDQSAATGIVKYTAGVPSNIAPGASGTALVSDGVNWGAQPFSLMGISTDTTTSVAFTPNSGAFGTIVNPAYSTSRQGDKLNFDIQFTTGTTSTGTASIAMPAGLTIKSSSYGSSLPVVVGTVNLLSSTNSLWIAGVGAVIFYDGSDVNNLYIGYQAGSNTTITKVAGSGLFGSGSSAEIKGSVAISQWSSATIGGAQGSVYASYYVNSGASTSSFTPINFDTRSVDSGAVTGTPICVPGTTTFKCTAPISGMYKISDTMYGNTVAQDLALYKNGTGAQFLNDLSASLLTSGSTEIFLNAGDYIDLRVTGGTFTTAPPSAGRPLEILSISLDSGYSAPPATTSYGISSDWSTNYSFTPSAGFGTVSATYYSSRRVGDTLEVHGLFTTGTVAASTASIALPSGLSIDSAKLPTNSSGIKVGFATNITSSGTAQQMYSGGDASDIFYDGSTTGSLFFASTVQSSAYVKSNANSFFGSSTPIYFDFTVPISGWSSNTIGSGTGAVTALYHMSANTSFASGAQINVDAKDNDTGCPNNGTPCIVTTGTSWKAQAPASGQYNICFTTLASVSGSGNILLYHNGAAYGKITSVSTTQPGSGCINGFPLKVGDTVDLRPDATVQLAGGSVGSGNSTILSLALVSGNAGVPVSVIGISTDAVAYTPTITGFGSVTSVSFWHSRTGDTENIWGTFTTGTPSATLATISLPSGQVIDPTKVPSGTNQNKGWYIRGNGSASTFKKGDLLIGGSGTTFGLSLADFTSSVNPLNVQFGNTVSAASGEVFTVEIHGIPISGWSSSTIGTGQGSVLAAYGLTTQYTPTVDTAVLYDTKISDAPTPNFNTSTGVFTSPVTGTISVKVVGGITTGVTNFRLVKNGSTGLPGGALFSTVSATVTSSGSMDIPVQAGDTLAVYQDSAHPLYGTTANGYNNWVSFTLASGNGSGNVSSSGTGNDNFLSNLNFQDTGITSSVVPSWTLGTGVAAAADTSVRYGNDPQSLKLTLTAATGNIISQDVTVDGSVQGTNTEESLYVNSTLTALEVCARAAGSSLTGVCTAVPPDGLWHPVLSPGQPGPASGSIGVSLYATGSSTGTVNLARGYVGPARNLGTVAQAQWLGSIKTAETSGCNWVAPSTGAPANVTANASCPTPTVSTGSSITAPATKIPGFILPSKGAGLYKFVAKGSFYADVETCNARFSDGTNSSATMTYMFSGSAGEQGLTPTIEGEIYYATAPAANTTIQIQLAAVTTPGNCIIQLQGGANTAGLEISAYYYPPKSQIISQSNKTPANWGGTSNLLATTTSTSMGVVNGGLSGSVTANATNEGITCSAAASTLGIACTLPTTGAYNVCYSGYYYTNTNGDGTSVELVDGSGTVISGAQREAVPGPGNYVGFSGCGNYNAASTSETFQVYGDVLGAGSTGTFSVTGFSVFALNQNQNAPNLIGSVTSSDPAKSYHLESAYITNNGSACGVSSSSTAGITAPSRAGLGQCNISFTGLFSAAPWCWCNVDRIARHCQVMTITSTGALLSTEQGGSQEDNGSSISCMGPR